MPLSEDVRRELAGVEPHRHCDRLAELSGLFHTAGSLHLRGHGEFAVHLDLATSAVARRAFTLVRSFGIEDVEDDPVVRALPKGAGPRLFFQKVPEAKTAKNRVHVDVTLRDRAHLDRLLELGASVVREWDNGDGIWLTDPQGNDFCVYLPTP